MITEEKKELVLIWGWFESEESSKRLVSLAPDNFSVHTVSLERLLPGGRIEQLDQRLVDYLSGERINGPILAGHSLGGGLALSYASRNPDKIKRLILADCEGVPGNEGILGLMSNLLSSHLSEKGKVEGDHLKTLYRMVKNPRYSWSLANLALKLDLQHEATKVTVPTQIIWADQDRITPFWQGARLHQLLPGSSLTTLKDIDHNWILHSPELFWQTINIDETAKKA